MKPDEIIEKYAKHMQFLKKHGAVFPSERQAVELYDALTQAAADLASAEVRIRELEAELKKLTPSVHEDTERYYDSAEVSIPEGLRIENLQIGSAVPAPAKGETRERIADRLKHLRERPFTDDEVYLQIKVPKKFWQDEADAILALFPVPFYTEQSIIDRFTFLRPCVVDGEEEDQFTSWFKVDNQEFCIMSVPYNEEMSNNIRLMFARALMKFNGLKIEVEK